MQILFYACVVRVIRNAWEYVCADINIAASQPKRENTFRLCALAFFWHRSRSTVLFALAKKKIYICESNTLILDAQTRAHVTMPAKGLRDFFYSGHKATCENELIGVIYTHRYTSEYSAHKNNEDFFKSFSSAHLLWLTLTPEIGALLHTTTRPFIHVPKRFSPLPCANHL